MATDKIRCLDTLITVGRRLSSDTSLTQRQILEILHEHACELMNATNMVIALYDRAADVPIYELVYQDGKEVQAPPSNGDARRSDHLPDLPTAKAIDAVLRWGLREGRPLLLPMRASWQSWNRDIQPAAASWLSVPMIIGTKTIGTLAVYHPSEYRVYSNDDLRYLQALADYGAIALENKEVNAQLKSMVEIGRELSSNIQLDEHETLTLIRHQLSPLMRTDNMYIALHDDDKKNTRFGLVYANGVHLDDWLPSTGGTSRMWWIINNGEPLLHHTRAAGERWYAEMERHNAEPVIFSSYLGVPMTACGKTIGVIALYHPEQEYVFGDNDLDILLPLARYAGIALYNAQLYREARGDLLAAKKLATLGTAMGAIQHRIRNSLTFIAPQVTSLRHRVDTSNPDINQILDDIEQNVIFTQNLIARLNQLANEGAPDWVRLETTLHHLVEDAKRRFREVCFTLDIDNDLPPIRASDAQLTEIFINLLENASRALKDVSDGCVTISATSDLDSIFVRVRDNGRGINRKVLDRLFIKPVPSANTNGQSSGLGLWLSKLILNSMGGNIAVEETSPEHGTTFLITLPTHVPAEV